MSDIDIVVVCEARLDDAAKQAVVDGVLAVAPACPARGLERTVYRREVVTSPPQGADFEVNVNGGPRMPTSIRGRAGVLVRPRSGHRPPFRRRHRGTAAGDLARRRAEAVDALAPGAREGDALLGDVLGSNPEIIDAAVDLRLGRPADLDAGGVDRLLRHVGQALRPSPG